MPLEGPDRDKFIKLIGLLGSEFAAERAVAAEKATQMLRDRGMTWADAFNHTTVEVRYITVTPPQRDYTEPYDPEWREILETWGHSFVLSDWEQEFSQNIVARRNLSEKQVRVIDRIIEKLHAAGCI
jgi:hypothetical protein